MEKLIIIICILSFLNGIILNRYMVTADLVSTIIFKTLEILSLVLPLIFLTKYYL